MIAHSTGFRRVVHHPQPRGVVLAPDKLWETLGNSPSYVGQRKDGMLECYYLAHWWVIQPGVKEPPRYEHPNYKSCFAYAISEDGIHWEKPILNLVDGPADIDHETWPPYPVSTGSSKANNLVPCRPLRDPGQFGNVSDPAKRFAISLKHGPIQPAPLAPFRIHFGSEPPDIINDPQWRGKFVDSGG